MKRNKPSLRLTAALLSLLAVLTLLPMTAHAAVSGDFEYLVNKDGTASITKYTGSEVHVTVPGTIDGYPVYRVCDDTFYDLDNIESITFSEGIVVLDSWTIAYCNSLIRVNFPSTLSYLDQPVAFCTGFREVSFPNGSPYFVAKDNVIYSSDMKTLLLYPAGKTDRRFVAPGSLTFIGNFAFYCQEYVEEIVLPDSIECLGFASFQAARKLERLNIPANCTDIFQFALDSTKIKYLHIPAKLEILYANNCPSKLERITIDPANPFYTVVDKGLYTKNEKGEPDSLMMYCCGDPSDTLIIPDSVEFLASGSLEDASNLRYLDLGSSVNQVANQVLPSYLIQLIIPATMKQFDEDNFGIKSIGLHQIYYEGTEEQWFAIDGISEAKFWEPVHVHFNVTDPENHSTLLSGTRIYCQGDANLEWSCKCGHTWTEATYGLGHLFSEWTLIEMEPPGHWVYERKCLHCDETQTETTAEPKCAYYDVSAYDFYHNSVVWADLKGITTGTAPRIFSPNNPCLRAQVVTFLWRAAGCPEPTITENPFVDVKETDFYYKSVLWALEKGITAGLDADHFGPMANCNRAQVVTFLYRTMGSPELADTANPFTDIPDGSWYTAPVLWAVENGVTNGQSATTFGPDSVCNRAQIVTFLFRAFGW